MKKKSTKSKYYLEREKAFHEKGMRMAESAEKSSKRNPSGKTKFDYAQDKLTGKPYKVVPLPDAAHAARLRGAASRKARGTQSSSTRKIIK